MTTTVRPSSAPPPPTPTSTATEIAAATSPTTTTATSGPRGTRPTADRHLLRLLVAAVVVGAALRIAIGLTDDAPSTDETAYLMSGESLVEGHGFEREGRPELHFPPFVPFLLGLAGKVAPDPHTGTVGVTILAGTALLVPLTLLARRLAGPRAAVATAWIAALAPGLATMGATRGSGSEIPYALLVVTGVWLVVSSGDHLGRGRLLRVSGAGLALGLAYLSRPEGLLIAVPVGAAAVVLAYRRPPDRSPANGPAADEPAADEPPADGHRDDEPSAHGRRAGLRSLPWLSALLAGMAFAAPLLVCVVPYATYLHDHTGSWQLTAKTQDVSLEAWHAVARNDRHTRDRILYQLDGSGLAFRDERSSLVTLAREDPGGYLAILGTNVRALLADLRGTSLVPLPVTLLAVYGAWRLRRSRAVWLVGAVAALPVLTALAFFVMPRYLVVVSAVATVLAGVGAVELGPRLRPVLRVAGAGLVVAPLVVTSVQAFHGVGGWWHPADHPEQRRAGEWIAAHTDPDDRIMARSLIVSYYAERPTVATPYADLDRIVAFARHYGVQYLVVDDHHSRRVRPQLLPLLTEEQAAGLRLVHEVHAEGRTSRIFALVPPPPPTDEVGPSLGFMGDGAA